MRTNEIHTDAPQSSDQHRALVQPTRRELVTLMGTVPLAAAVLPLVSGSHTAYAANDEITVFDTDECAMVVTGFEGDGETGFTMTVRFENKTDDLTLMFSTDNESLNGWMISALCAESVTPGSTAIETLSWRASKLEGYGFTDITDVGFSARVYDYNDWLADNFVKDYFEIYPLGEAAAQETASETIAYESDAEPLIDTDDIAVGLLGYEGDATEGFTVKLFLENKTATTMMVTTDDDSINGWMADPFWSKEIAPHKKMMAEVDWSKSTLADLDFDEITDIEFTLRAYDSDDWLADRYIEEKLDFYPLGEDAVVAHEREPEPDDLVLFDEAGVKMTVISQGPGSFYPYQLGVCLENDTDLSVYFNVTDATLNGIMCDPYWSKEVQLGKKALSTISWSNSQLEKIDLSADDIDAIVLYLRVYDSNDWWADDLVNTSVTF